MQGIFYLASRSMIEVKGADAAVFLQNVFTNDIDALTDKMPLQYSLLLSPQGQVLHEIFILRRNAETFWLDVWQPRKADLVRRLTMFRLRAKVDIVNTDIKVYAGNCDEGVIDPRFLDGRLGKRCYTAVETSADHETGYHDFCILHGIATPQAIRFEKDFTHDLGLEKLNAIAWDKGCFIGQEVAARVEHRGLSKKGLFTVTCKQEMTAGSAISADGMEVGEIRSIASDGRYALAVIKKMALENGGVLMGNGAEITLKAALG